MIFDCWSLKTDNGTLSLSLSCAASSAWFRGKSRDFMDSYKTYLSSCILKNAWYRGFDNNYQLKSPPPRKITPITATASLQGVSLDDSAKTALTLLFITFSYLHTQNEQKMFVCFLEWIFPLRLRSRMSKHVAESKDTAGTPVLCVLSEAWQHS